MRVYGRPEARRRRRLLVLVTLLAALSFGAGLVVGAASYDADPARDLGTVRLTAGRTVVVEQRAAVLRGLSPSQLSELLAKVPPRWVERRGRAQVVLETDRQALRRAAVRTATAGGGTVEVAARPVASRARLPTIKQALRNNCETAALSMLLAARGVEAKQLELQRELPTSGPPDPRPAGGSAPAVWGDPEQGFVGRADGGGTSGGYGVYEKPIRELARRRGVVLTGMSGESPRALYRRLLSGRQVMVWVGLSAGPYKTWSTPGGRRVTANLGEHTVVLTGLRGQSIEVNDPLMGRRTTWTRAYFEELWQRLGRRAISV